MDQSNTHGDAAFFEQWAIYQSVIANNYMFHAEIIDLIRQQLGGFRPTPVSARSWLR